MSTPNQRILWADDEIDMLRPHILYLKSKGYEVILLSHHVDEIWPERIREFDADLPVVLISGDMSEHSRARAQQLGAAGLFHKSSDVSLVVEHVLSLCARQSGPSSKRELARA